MKNGMDPKKIKIIQMLILLLTVILMLCIYPLRMIRENTESAAGGDRAYAVSEKLEQGTLCKQELVMQQDYCKSISVALALHDNEKKDGSVIFSLYNKEKCIIRKKIPLSDFADAEYCEISINKWIRKGSSCFYTLAAENCGNNVPALYMTQDPSQCTPGNVLLTIGNHVQSGQSVDRIRYQKSLRIYNTMMLWAFLILLDLLLMEGLRCLTEREEP